MRCVVFTGAGGPEVIAVEEDERRLVDVERQNQRRVDRATLGHHELRDEDLQARDQSDHGAEENGRLQEWHGDVTEGLPTV